MVKPERYTILNRWIPDEERDELFRRAAVVVLPYVSASQSGVVSVAYNHAKPVVATNVGALPEAVRDGVTGFIVPPRDHIALAEAVVKLLDDSVLRHRMGVAGQEMLWKECAPEVVARRTEEVYRLAASDRGKMLAV